MGGREDYIRSFLVSGPFKIDLRMQCRGVTRNLLRGGPKRGMGDGSPQRGPGAEPRWGSWDKPQKPETHAEH